MDSTSKKGNLSEQIQQIENGGSSEETPQKFKEVLLRVVNGTLKQDKLVADTSWQNDIRLSLEFIGHAIQVCPSLFAPHFLQHGHGDAREEEPKRVYGVLWWLVSHLLRILKQPECSDITMKTRDLIPALLNLIRSMDPYTFRRVLNELVFCLGDLSGFHEAFYEENNNDIKELQRFIMPKVEVKSNSSEQSEPQLQHRPIILISPEACENLQANISEIIIKMANDILPYGLNTGCYGDSEHEPDLLWRCVTSQIYNGEIHLKKVSVNLAYNTIICADLPSGPNLDFLINTLVALIKFLASGFNEIEGDYIGLEENLGKCLVAFVKSASVLHPVVHRCWIIENLLKGVLEALSEQGLQKLRTESLKNAICQTALNLLKAIPKSSSTSPVINRYSTSLALCMMKEIETGLQVKGSIKCLSWVIASELTNNLSKVSEVESSGESVKDFPSYSPLLRSIVSKINVILVSLKDDDASPQKKMSGLQAIQIFLEVVASCVIDYPEPKAPTSTSSKPASQGKPNSQCENLWGWVKISGLVREVVLFWERVLVWLSKKHVESRGGRGDGGDEKRKEDQREVSSYYLLIARSIGALISIKDVGDYSSEIYLDMIWMLSLHLMAEEMAWKDLRPKDVKGIATVASVLSDLLDDACVAEAIPVLALMPKENAAKWRTHVITAAASSSRPLVQAAAVRSFPFLLYHSGPNSNHLVYDVIHGVMSSQQSEVLEEIADITGPLACVVSRKAVLQRESHGDCEKLSYEKTCIRCVCCDELPVSQRGEGPWDRPKIVDPNMFQTFLTLLDTNDKNLKIKMIKNLIRLFGHISVRTNNEATVEMMRRCLTLLEDSDHSVRMEFSNVIRAFISKETSMTTSDTDTILVRHLKQSMSSATSAGHVAGVETVLITIGHLGRVAAGDLFLVVVISLLESICSPSSIFTSAVARTQLIQVAAHKQLEMRQLFLQFSRTICKSLAEQLHSQEQRRQGLTEQLRARSQQGQQADEGEDGDMADVKEELNKIKDPRDFIEDIADLFDFDGAKDFLGHSEKYILPFMIMKASKAASSLIRTIAKLMEDHKPKNLIARNIDYIFCHLVISLQTDSLLQSFSFLEMESDWELSALLRLGKNVDSELLLHLSSDYKEALRGIKILHHKLDTIQPHVAEDKVRELLQPKLLGILVHFDNHLNNGTIPLSEKKQAFESLILLMDLMAQKHITTVRVRLMTTLRIGMKFDDKEFKELCCRVWDKFVRTIELQSLGPMLAQIIVILQPLMKTFPRQIAKTLEYLIVENRTELCSYFHQLYFVPDIPELDKVNTVLREYLSGSDNCGLEQQLEVLLRGVNHESQDLRALALTKLRDLLHAHQSKLVEMITSTETVSPVISDIIKALLSGCLESDQSVRVLYGACLGEIGAIDPGRLELSSSTSKDEMAKFLSSVTEDNFAVELINTLAKAFLGAEDKDGQDCIAFSIQELIRIYGIAKEEGTTISTSKLFSRFSEEVQEIMQPLTRSRYKLNMKHDWSHLQKPIYNSKKGKKFETWVTTLAGYLTSQVGPGKAYQVFEACRAVIRNESNIALYLLPYLATQVLLDAGSVIHAELRDEIMAVLNDFKDRNSRNGTSTSDLRFMSAQTVFTLLDHFTKWERHRLMVLISNLKNLGHGKAAAAATEKCYKDDTSYQCIHHFLEQIPKDQLAGASYNCSAYTRSLMHIEQFIKAKHISENQANLHQNLDFIQKLYMGLDEPDGVAGIAAIKQSPPTLREQILAFEALGQASDASVCYDQVIQLEPREISHHQGLLRCRLALGELNSAMTLANGIIAERSSWTSSFNTFRVEAAWKLGQWDKLGTFLKMEKHSHDWNVGLGKVLYAVKTRDETNFVSELHKLRDNLMTPLSAASMEVGSYHRGYDHIVRLHMLNELEQGVKCLLSFPRTPASSQPIEPITTSQLLEQWDARLQLTQCVFRTQEPILTLRRTILSLALTDANQQLHNEVGKCWLNVAKVARECGLVQTAHSSLVSASAYPDLAGYGIEKAKWLWDRGDYDIAMSCLERTIDQYYPDRSKIMDASTSPADKLACAKVLLLLSQYCEQTASMESNAIVRQYKEVMKVHNQWEDAYFHVAKYYDKIMTSILPDRAEKKGDFIMTEIQFFGQSLKYGNLYIYESMPRMLSLWLDYGAEVVEGEQHKSEMVLQGMRTVLTQINRYIANATKELAPYQFLTAFPQLTSRICHAHPQVFTQLRELIAKLVVTFPQQTMWMMMAVSKSSYKIRMKRCKDIFHSAKMLNPNLDKFLQDATKLTDRLLDLCNKPCDPSLHSLSISQTFKPLQRLISDKNFSNILLPLQSLMTVTLPSASSGLSNHDPFPMTSVYISGIEDTVELLASLQRPKKITLRGSDGRFYIMLCKPKDDLRKDARLMEFNTIINKFLRKNFESRRRDLHIRTYTVTPLNEECGMLEWVSHTTGLRHILLKIYKERGIYVSGHELRSMQVPVNSPLDKKLDMYRNKLLPKHPAVFSEWFLKTFQNPTCWYNARLSYARTTAVMSMVGYILGLGDRHGENILLDSTNGDVVHVDFNCLFNKGELFDCPEIVPFRLTHNMVEAMGPTGYEGVYRRACEVTLRVMRNQSDPLMSILKTFIYDPLVEWSKSTKQRAECGETKNEKAFTHVSNIQSRLKGELTKSKSRRGLPLSVEGHVNHLIKVANDEKNLCQMYIGWAPYM